MAQRPQTRPGVPEPAQPQGRWLRLLAFVGAATLLAMAAWAIGHFAGLGAHSEEAEVASPTPSVAQKFGPQVVSATRIAGLPAELGHAVFWAGPAPAGKVYELTIAADDSVAIRYLDQADPAAAGQALLVGTFARANAFAVLTEEAKAEGMRSATPAPGWLVLLDERDTLTGYVAIEGLGYLGQVFQPEPGRTWEMLNAATIAPIPSD
ncbi:MAG: hypothetical protein ACOYEV_04050 [Candidatus Nanopelagicales bacterium]